MQITQSKLKKYFMAAEGITSSDKRQEKLPAKFIEFLKRKSYKIAEPKLLESFIQSETLDSEFKDILAESNSHLIVTNEIYPFAIGSIELERTDGNNFRLLYFNESHGHTASSQFDISGKFFCHGHKGSMPVLQDHINDSLERIKKIKEELEMYKEFGYEHD